MTTQRDPAAPPARRLLPQEGLLRLALECGEWGNPDLQRLADLSRRDRGRALALAREAIRLAFALRCLADWRPRLVELLDVSHLLPEDRDEALVADLMTGWTWLLSHVGRMDVQRGAERRVGVVCSLRRVPDPVLELFAENMKHTFWLRVPVLGEGTTLNEERRTLPLEGFGSMLCCDYLEIAQRRAAEFVQATGLKLSADLTDVRGVRMVVFRDPPEELRVSKPRARKVRRWERGEFTE